jgi:hypothetical protein
MERHVAQARRMLRDLVGGFLRWLHGEDGRCAGAPEAHRRFVILRLRFNSVLAHFDIFAEVLSQRSQHDYGVWLAGLDALASDALEIPGCALPRPPIVCYLDRGYGAAIRRARTRLPGGGANPVAIIRVPRERVIGAAVASSLVHEVGHQAAAMLSLLPAMRAELRQALCAVQHSAWRLWDRWLGEVVADFWAVARVGVAATLGLFGVLSLPRAFVFRIDDQGVHPSPFIRAKLSCAIGQELFPHAQWGQLARVWERFYPKAGLSPALSARYRQLEGSLPRVVKVMAEHRARRLGNVTLRQALRVHERHPARLSGHFQSWCGSRARRRRTRPSLAFAILGQAKLDGRLSPEHEGRLVADLLTHWALRRSVGTHAACAVRSRTPTASRAA